MRISAAVLEEVGTPFVLTEVDLQDPAPEEVVVKIAGVGICHTDIAVREGHLPFPLPGVLGHEGAGIVAAVGANVTDLAVGDNVALSFHSCGSCSRCAAAEPAYCHRFMEYNFGGARTDGSTGVTASDTKLGARFFGQSSFATHAIAHRRNTVKLPAGAPLDLVGPLGCGIQTGAGAIMNSLDVQPGTTLAIAGGGSVGLAAALAGVVREASKIVVIEPDQARRDLAVELGATHVIDPTAGNLLAQVRDIAPEGVDYAVDTTAIPSVVESLIQALGVRGAIGLLGVPSDPVAAFSAGMFQVPLLGLTIRGIVEGDADPQTFIPYLYDLYRQGRFPYDKLITRMPLGEINEAIAALDRGDVVKVVLTP